MGTFEARIYPILQTDDMDDRYRQRRGGRGKPRPYKAVKRAAPTQCVAVAFGRLKYFSYRR